jgi:N-acetylglucosamine-6-phosphate deacetylase
VALALADCGVGRFCPTVTTAGAQTLERSLRAIDEACRAWPHVERRVAGIHLEGPYISAQDGPRGAHPREHCRPPDMAEFARLQSAAGGRIRLVTLSPEYDAAPDFIRQLTSEGIVVAIGHTAASGEQIRRAVDAGARLSTHLGNGAHPQLPRHPNYIWDQLADDRLSASLIVDGHHLPPAVVQSFVRAKTPQRLILVSDLSPLAGLPPGEYRTALCHVESLPDGRLVVAGQRQLLAAASEPIGTGVANVMRFAGLDLVTAVELATSNPARLLGLPVHDLAVGAPADVVLFDLDLGESGGRLAVRQTILGGLLAFAAT